jgi:hypothetical protein
VSFDYQPWNELPSGVKMTTVLLVLSALLPSAGISDQTLVAHALYQAQLPSVASKEFQYLSVPERLPWPCREYLHHAESVLD